MMNFLESAKRFLWMFVEFGFLVVLSILLIYLILGQDSGVFIVSVAENVQKFANGFQASALVGLAVVLALVFFIKQRMKPPAPP